jgi:hypothetical protein
VIDALLLALALAVPAAQPAPSEAPAAVPSPAAPASPVETPLPASPLPEASATALPAPTLSPLVEPAASPTADPYAYRFVPRQPAHPEAGTPQIFAVYLNDRTLRSGGVILIKVATSPDVVKVVSRSGGREGVLRQAGPGDFEANSKLPKIPFIAEGMTTLLEFVASNADGKTVSVKVPVKLL